jgi:cysteine desulfurase
LAALLSSSIYLDHNATTPLDPEVRAVMIEAVPFGNPSSMHQVGQEARRWVDRARVEVAKLLGSATEDIIFTSGGTEANNLAIIGVTRSAIGAEGAVVTSAIEHHSVLAPCEHLQRQGRKVLFLPVDLNGCLSLPALAASQGSRAALYSIMLANNDTGVIQPISEVVKVARASGAWVHTDAVQAVGKIPLDVKTMDVDLLSLSSHKIYGPKGIGALYVRRGVPLAPLIYGGKQERSLRPGSENLLGIIGFGKACALAAVRLAADRTRLSSLRDLFETWVQARIPGVQVNGAGERVPTTSNLRFPGIDAEAILVNLDLLGISVSLGSACSSASKDPSHVILAMGQTEAEARSSVRFSFGRETTEVDIRRTVDCLAGVVANLGGKAHG